MLDSLRRSVLMAALIALACNAPEHGSTQPAPNAHEPERVAALAALGRAAEADLVFVGDSITQLWETTGKQVWEDYYSGRRAINLGVGWEQTQNVLWRLERGHFDRLRPRLIVLLIGTNNSQQSSHSPEGIADGVGAILSSFRQKMPATRVLLLGIFPRGRKLQDPHRKNTQAANQLLRRFADGKRVFYRDIGHVFVRDGGSVDPTLMPDFVHLSERGYALWAEAIEDDIERLMAPPQP
jgi:lysophospholipase L1-like esterase